MFQELKTITSTSITYTLDQLVEALRNRQPSALAYLYDHYSATLFGNILRIVPVKKVAEEVLQDVFLSVWLHIESYKEQRGTLFTWM